MGFPRQEYWSRLPFPSPGDLPDPGIELVSPASPTFAGRFFTTEPPGKPKVDRKKKPFFKGILDKWFKLTKSGKGTIPKIYGCKWHLAMSPLWRNMYTSFLNPLCTLNCEQGNRQKPKVLTPHTSFIYPEHSYCQNEWMLNFSCKLPTLWHNSILSIFQCWIFCKFATFTTITIIVTKYIFPLRIYRVVNLGMLAIL